MVLGKLFTNCFQSVGQSTAKAVIVTPSDDTTQLWQV